MRTVVFAMFAMVGLAIGCRAPQGGDVGTPAKGSPIRVAVYVGRGARSVGAYRHLQIATFAEGVEGFPVDAQMIRDGVLDRADVLVMPGGAARVELAALEKEGGRRIAEFVRRGGGYIGTCAGGYLVSQPTCTYSNRLGLIPYFGGSARPDDVNLAITFSDKAVKELGLKKSRWVVSYAGGPQFVPSGKSGEGGAAEVAAVYSSDVNACGTSPLASMAGKGAVILATYGKGRIFASAIHPEKSEANHDILRAALRYVSGKASRWTFPGRRPRQLSVAVQTGDSLGVDSARALQKIMRAQDIRLTPVNADAIRYDGYRSFDVLLVPDTVDFRPKGGALGVNADLTNRFLDRGGRVVVWGRPAEAYRKFGRGVTVVADGDAALAELRRIAAEPFAPGPVAKPKVAKPIRAQVYFDKGGRNFGIGETLDSSPSIDVRFVTGEDIRKGSLAAADLIHMPGGSCEAERQGLQDAGVAALTNFVWQGGSYYGICAGAFLASQSTPRYVRTGMVPFVHDNSPFRGGARIRTKLTEEGRRIYGTNRTCRSVYYHGGPVFVPGRPVPGTDVRVLAKYAGVKIQTTSTNAVLPMAGKAAIVGGRVGKGRIIVQAPHPEADDSTYDMVHSAIRYLTGITIDTPRRFHRRGLPEVGCAVRTADEANFCLKRLVPNERYNVKVARPGASAVLAGLDVYVIPCPTKDDWTADVRRLVKDGRAVVVRARTEDERNLVASWAGVRVVASSDDLEKAVSGLAR